MLKQTPTALALSSALLAGSAQAADYKIDIPGQHAFVNFKVSHIGFSFIYGSFNKFDGSFSYDAAKPADSKIDVTIDTTSLIPITLSVTSICAAPTLSMPANTHRLSLFRLLSK